MKLSTFDHIARPSAAGYRSSVIREIYEMMSARPHAIAVTDGDLEWTYDCLRRRSQATARELANHGIGRGSVVGMHLPRCSDTSTVLVPAQSH